MRADEHTVSVYHDDVLLDTHDRKGKGPRSTNAAHLPQQREPYRHRSRDFWEQRAGVLGQEVRAYVCAVFDSDKEVSQLRAVQSIVTHLETFPPASRPETPLRRS